MRDNNYQFQTYKVSVAPSEVNKSQIMYGLLLVLNVCLSLYL